MRRVERYGIVWYSKACVKGPLFSQKVVDRSLEPVSICTFCVGLEVFHLQSGWRHGPLQLKRRQTRGVAQRFLVSATGSHKHRTSEMQQFRLMDKFYVLDCFGSFLIL